MLATLAVEVAGEPVVAGAAVPAAAAAVGAPEPGVAAPGTVSPPEEARRLGLLLEVAEMERCTLWCGGDWRLVGGGPAAGPVTCRSDSDEPDWEPSDSSCAPAAPTQVSSQLR